MYATIIVNMISLCITLFCKIFKEKRTEKDMNLNNKKSRKIKARKIETVPLDNQTLQ